MGTIERLPSNEQALKQLNERLAQLKAASEIAVVDQTTFISSAQTKLDLESFIEAVEDHFEPELAPAEEKVKRVKLAMAPFLQAKQWLTGLNNRRKEWAIEERAAAKRDEERKQREYEAAQRQKADEERRAAEKLAAHQRKAREAELEAQRKAGEIGKREEARQAKIAAEEEAKAKELAAKQAAETAAKVPVVKVEPNIPKVPGTRNTINWRYRILDVNAIPEEYWMLNEQKLKEEVRRDKERTNIPGIEAYPE